MMLKPATAAEHLDGRHQAMLRRIHHAAIICSNYAVSKRFYVETLGLTVVAENFREARQSYKLDLQLPDGSQIELFSFPNAPARPSYPEARGLRHLAFEVLDVERCKRQLESAGVVVEPIRLDEYTNRRFVFFADPDGLPLELYEAEVTVLGQPTLPPDGPDQRSNTDSDGSRHVSAELRAKAIGLELSGHSVPAGNYANAARSGDLLFLSGKAPLSIDGRPPKGRLGREYSVADGYALARSACTQLLAVLKRELGSLDNVARIVELHGSINAVPEFEEHAKVLDGASDLLVEIFGPAGVHARSVVGVSSLRGGLPLTLKAIVEVERLSPAPRAA
jgi:glyoxylase I family protein